MKKAETEINAHLSVRPLLDALDALQRARDERDRVTLDKRYSRETQRAAARAADVAGKAYDAAVVRLLGGPSSDQRVRRYYVCQFGSAWSMNAQAFERFLVNGAAGNGWDMRDYGREIGKAPRVPGRVIKPIGRPDWSPETFRGALEQFRRTGEVY